MSQEAKVPPSGPPTEEDTREFERKFREFFDSLPERQKLQAASLRVVAAEEDQAAESQETAESQGAEPLSEEEIQDFVSKLNSFHDSLPEGQHQILDAMTAKAFVHSVPEDDQDDVQGNVWLWFRWIYPGDTTSKRYYENYCYQQGGRTYYTASQYVSGVGTYWQIGCWR